MISPLVLIITKICHPNIDNLGRVSLDILEGRWRPALTIKNLLESIRYLMSHPDFEDGYANREIIEIYKNDPEKAMKMIRECTL